MTTVSSVERQVSASLRRAVFSQTGTSLVVACSGGPDSTALLRCLHHLQMAHDLTLHVAHLNHDFRGAEADHDAAFVQRLADSLGLPCSMDKQDPIAYQRARGLSSFEQAAREMRYRFLSEVATTVGASAVSLGHTSDDQAETVLMHILRGSGLQGLRGMSELVEWPWPEPGTGPPLFRPLLGIGKAETASYCRDLSQTYREDSGNYMWRFTRNKVRLDLMPRLARDYNPRVHGALLRLSRAAAEEADYIESELDRYWPEIANVGDGTASLDARALTGLHAALRRRALLRAYAFAAGDARALSERHLDAMMSLVDQGRGGRALDLPRNVSAQLEGDSVKLAKRSGTPTWPELIGEHTIRVPSNSHVAEEINADGWRVRMMLAGCQRADGSEIFQSDFSATLRKDVLGEFVTIRSRRPGDRFQPVGMSGTKKLQDFFTDEKIPRSQRGGIPLLVCQRGVAWVAGHRVAEWAVARERSEIVRVTLSVDR